MNPKVVWLHRYDEDSVWEVKETKPSYSSGEWKRVVVIEVDDEEAV